MAVTAEVMARRAAAPRLIAASIIGVVTGLVVLGLEHLVDGVLEEVFDGPVWVPALTVVAGALVTAALVRWIGGRSSATTEVYVEEFHEEDPTLDPTHAPGRLAAAFTTLGSGAPLGMEGPAVYTGSAIATLVRRRWPVLANEAHSVVLIAGAAAGIAAVFKAPASGAIFALEVPYRGRMAGERVLPAIFGSATGFLTMAIVDGVEPELELPPVELTYGRSVSAVLLGAVIGCAAIGFIALLNRGEHLSSRGSPWIRALAGGGVLAILYAVGRGLAGESLALGSGNNVIEWAIQPDHAVGLLLAVVVLRALGPAASIAGGGVGGLFIPLMALGAVIGRLFADALNAEALVLDVTVGAATMLGVGYAVPLTGVVFVAEYTGQATVILPSMLAMTTAMLLVGSRSVSPAQQP
ncbi:MAG: chloride channel protein [Acidimicrobiia bacterium]|nr:chloride channel protein [Acidimicrobiia bacterium]